MKEYIDVLLLDVSSAIERTELAKRIDNYDIFYESRIRHIKDNYRSSLRYQLSSCSSEHDRLLQALGKDNMSKLEAIVDTASLEQFKAFFEKVKQ